jgi:NhaP-type Na+/H+ or K+/H+ antiporter
MWESAVSGIIRLAGGYTDASTSASDSTHATTGAGFQAGLLGFSPSIFYFGFLPLIIFESGYHLKRQLFFNNFLPIVLLALVGTCISIAIFSVGIYALFNRYSHVLASSSSTPIRFSMIESVCFAALISSTDPVSTLVVFSSYRVDPVLYYLVFGESVLNDAIAITVFSVAAKFVSTSVSGAEDDGNGNNFDTMMLDCVGRSIISFVISCLLGYLCGIVCARCFRTHSSPTANAQTDSSKSNNVFVVTTFLCMVYLPFFLSECLQLSGIVTVLFAGVSMRRYFNKNVSVQSKVISSFVLKTLVAVAEIACFCMLGMSVFSQSINSFLPALCGCSMLLITVARAMHVYPLLMLVSL